MNYIRIVCVIVVLLVIQVVYSQDTIPIEIKEDNRIYLKGKFNESDTLSLVFDLGANITVVNKTKIKDNNISVQFDSLVSNSGTNGMSKEELSLNNIISINNTKYNNIEILGINYPENDTLDGIIGWNLFKDKIIKINYEGKEILVYDNLPKLSEGYVKRRLKFINNLPFIEVIIYKGNRKIKIWAMLDTGYNGALLVYYDPVTKNKLLNQFPLIGEGTTHGTDGSIIKSDWVLLPRFEIGDFELYHMPVYLTKTESTNHRPALLGGNLLKRFHIVLDFKQGFVYLKPNLNINSKF